MHNTHILWKTIHGLSNRVPPPTLNTYITFSNKTATTPKYIANCFTKQFTNPDKHTTNKTNRYINRATQKYKDITSHSLQLRSNIGPLGLAFHTSIQSVLVLKTQRSIDELRIGYAANTHHLHDETNVLPIHQHLQLHASQIRQKAQHPTHPLHKLTIDPHTPRLKKTNHIQQHQLHHQHRHTPRHSHTTTDLSKLNTNTH